MNRDTAVNAASGVGTGEGGNGLLSRELAGVLLTMCLLTCLIGTRTDLWRTKRFDDVSAVGNGCHLARGGEGREGLFFRSRLRPGFALFVAPLCLSLEHELSEEKHSQADFGKRLFHLYDRKGERIYPEVSVAVLLFVSATLTVLFRVAVDRGMARSSALAWVAGLACVLRAISGPVLTLAFTFAMHVWTIISFLWFVRRPGWGRATVAGLVAAFGLLTKEDLILTLAGVVVAQIGLLWRRQSPRLIVCYWLVSLVPLLLWLEVGLGGALHELADFRKEVRDVGWMVGYVPASLPGHLNAIAKSIGWTAVAGLAGAILALAPWRGFGSIRRLVHVPLAALLSGLALAHVSLAALPYVLPRFYVVLALPATYSAVNWLHRSSARLPGRFLAPVELIAAASWLAIQPWLPLPLLAERVPENAFQASGKAVLTFLGDSDSGLADRGTGIGEGGLELPQAGRVAGPLERILWSGCRVGTFTSKLVLMSGDEIFDLVRVVSPDLQVVLKLRGSMSALEGELRGEQFRASWSSDAAPRVIELRLTSDALETTLAIGGAILARVESSSSFARLVVLPATALGKSPTGVIRLESIGFEPDESACQELELRTQLERRRRRMAEP